MRQIRYRYDEGRPSVAMLTDCMEWNHGWAARPGACRHRCADGGFAGQVRHRLKQRFKSGQCRCCYPQATGPSP